MVTATVGRPRAAFSMGLPLSAAAPVLLVWLILGMLAMVADAQPGTDRLTWLGSPSPGLAGGAQPGSFAPTPVIPGPEAWPRRS